MNTTTDTWTTDPADLSRSTVVVIGGSGGVGEGVVGLVGVPVSATSATVKVTVPVSVSPSASLAV